METDQKFKISIASIINIIINSVNQRFSSFNSRYSFVIVRVQMQLTINQLNFFFFLAYSTRLIRKSISSQFLSFPQVCVNKLWVCVARRWLEGVIGKHQQLSGREIGGHLKSWTRSSEVKWLIKFEATSPLLY